MEQRAKAVFVKEQVAPLMISVIDEAQQYVVIVSPYLKIWRHAQIAIDQALKRGVRVTFVLRSDRQVVEGDDTLWLVNSGVTVLAVESLHAKVYLNEKTTVLSSMNFTEQSMNSMEIAYVVRDLQDSRSVGNYVKLLTELAKPVNSVITRPITKTAATSKGAGAPAFAGNCIRCKEKITFDPSRPLCQDCYEVWSEWQNEDYEEKFCHSCGSRAAVSYARPLCQTCYRSLR